MPRAVFALPFIPLYWAEPMVEWACSRRGNHVIYIVGVTPYNVAHGLKHFISRQTISDFFQRSILKSLMYKYMEAYIFSLRVSYLLLISWVNEL